MKYILLMQYSMKDLNAEGVPAWTPQDVQKNIAFLTAFNKELAEAGELVDSVPLAGIEQARVVSSRKDGPPVVSDGPFPESKEFVGGFWIIDVDTPERAVEIAARASTMPGKGGVQSNLPIEVRQIMNSRGDA